MNLKHLRIASVIVLLLAAGRIIIEGLAWAG